MMEVLVANHASKYMMSDKGSKTNFIRVAPTHGRYLAWSNPVDTITERLKYPLVIKHGQGKFR